MFDDLKQPEDMFSDTDKVSPQPVPPTQSMPPAASAPAPQPAPSAPSYAAAPQPSSAGSSMDLPEVGAGPGRIVKMIVVILAILSVIGGAFYLSMRILRSKTPTTPEPPALVEEKTQEVPQQVPEPVVTPQPVAEPEPVIELDTDKDGLTDASEVSIGTDPTKSDTDADGLFDREEVEVYKTNPLLADTDGDTYLDGSEVQNGYNPNGPGTLRQLPQ